MVTHYYSLYECFEMLAAADVAALMSDVPGVEAEMRRLATAADRNAACRTSGPLQNRSADLHPAPSARPASTAFVAV